MFALGELRTPTAAMGSQSCGRLRTSLTVTRATVPRTGLNDKVVTAMWHMHDVGWGWWLLMSVGMVAFWTLVLYAIVLVARAAAPGRSRHDDAEAPTEVLRRRLAEGQITVEEYERLRGVLDDDARGRREPALR